MTTESYRAVHVHDEAVRIDSIALLGAIELAMRRFADNFTGSGSIPSDPQRAAPLETTCATLLAGMGDARSPFQLPARPNGVH